MYTESVQGHISTVRVILSIAREISPDVSEEINMKLKKPDKKIQQYSLVQLLSIQPLGTFNECGGNFGTCSGTFDICNDDKQKC